MRKLRTRSRDSGTSSVTVALLIITGTLFVNTCGARAQEPDLTLPSVDGPCAPEVTENRRAVLANGGQPGIWFHSAVVLCMTGRLSALPLYAERVRLLEQRLTLSDERDVLRQREVQLAVEGEERAVGALEAAERHRREAEEERDAWYRHPILWVVVGGIIVAGIEALSLWAWSELSP